MKKLISFTLALLMLFTTIACSKGVPTIDSPDTTAAPTEGTTVITTEAETTVPNVDGFPIPQIPVTDYSGFSDGTFNVLGIGEDDIAHYNEFAVEEQAGDVIKDAVFKRNQMIKGKYNIEIVFHPTQVHSPGLIALQTAVFADSDEYQAAAISLYQMMTASRTGMFYSLTEIPHIDTSAPWYYQFIQDNLSIGGEEFLMASYLNMRIYDSSVLMFYSKKIAENLGLTNLDQLVLDGKWTWEKLKEYCAMYGRDVNNDGKYDGEDEVGMIAHNGYILSFFTGLGGKFVEKNSDDLPTYIGINEKNEAILSELLPFLFSEPDSLHGAYADLPYTEMFAEDHALFTAGNVYYQRVLSEHGANNYGVLPFPKADEAQERYYVHTHATHATAIGVPTTNKDVEPIGALLADLIYLSYEHIYPAHIEKTQQYRYAVDANATKILQLTFSSLCLELSTALNLSIDNTLRALGQRKISTFASYFEATKSADIALIDKFIENFVQSN
ncbi:MAG: hypothetical protein IKD37_04660 [Clostridia bacterium]|nr:hypothetical protein [Clostridia bacterium]